MPVLARDLMNMLQQLLLAVCIMQVLSCTPVPGQLLQDPASVKPPGCAATHRPSSDNQATDVTQTAAATSLPSMPEALDSQQTSLRKAAASNGDRAQVGSKRKRADSDNDAAMLNAGAEDTASAKQAQHSQQQQHVKQEPSLENGQTAVSNSDEVKPEPTHPPQFMQQHAEQQPQSNTPQTDVEEPTPEAQEGVQQPEVNPIVPHTVSQMSNWGHGEGQPLGGQTSWGDKLGRVVQWCWGYIVKEHVLTELQVSSMYKAGILLLPKLTDHTCLSLLAVYTRRSQVDCNMLSGGTHHKPMTTL